MRTELLPKMAGAPIAAPTRGVDFINMIKRSTSKRRIHAVDIADLIISNILPICGSNFFNFWRRSSGTRRDRVMRLEHAQRGRAAAPIAPPRAARRRRRQRRRHAARGGMCSAGDVAQRVRRRGVHVAGRPAPAHAPAHGRPAPARPPARPPRRASLRGCGTCDCRAAAELARARP